MMNLDAWIKNHPREKRVEVRESLAKKLGVSESYVRSMVNGNRTIPAEFAIPIENATGGQVTRHEIRPDLYPKSA